MSRKTRALQEPIIRDDDDKELEIVATDIFYRNQETQKPIVINRGGAGSSKCLIPGTKVVMADGHLKKIEDIIISDQVMGIDFKPRTVLEIHRGFGSLYRVDQSKAMSYVVNENHLLALKRGPTAEFKRKYKRMRTGNGILISVKDFIDQSKTFKLLFRGYRKIAEFPHKKVSIDPYFLGVWLGDGDSHRAGVTTMDQEIVNYLFEYAGHEGVGVKVDKWGRAFRSHGKADSYHLSNGNCKGKGIHKNPLYTKLKDYDLIGNKHIPNDFLYTDRKSRLQLLAGLIDTDGYLGKPRKTGKGNKKGYCYHISSSKEKLAKQIYYLVNSLGFKCSMWKLKTGIKSTGFVGSAWLIRIVGNITDVPVRIERKKAPVTNHHSTLISTLSVTCVEDGEYIGFSLDGDGLFFLQDFTVVHNSWSLCQLMLYKFFNEEKKKFFICRKAMPALRRSCYYDMDQLASEYGTRDQIIEEKVHMNWHYGSNMITFGGLDDPEKIKSSDFSYIWLEEATEFTYEDFQQLRLRLRRKSVDGQRNQIFLSFNPIDEFHWIKTRILDDPSYANDVIEIHSTYHDNPFLEEDAVKVLQGYEQQDISFYNIYTLGQWGKLENLIYRGWESVDYVPETSDRTIYGLDFGFNEPSVLERILIRGKDAWIDERIHHTKLTTTDLILKMQSVIPENEKRCTIYADPSSPEVIKEIKDAGFNIKPAIRSINPGIDFVKSFKLHIYSGGINTQKEFRAYSWKKDRDGNVTDDPIDALNHSCDATRYALYTALKGGSGFRVRVLG